MNETSRLEYLHAIELPTPFPVGPVTVYLGDAPGGPLTLVDTGPRSSRTRAALDTGLAALGHTVSDLDRIFVTHAHADHFGLAAELQAESGAEVVTHTWNVDGLADYRENRERLTEFYAGLLRRAAVPVEILVTVYEATRAVNHFAQPVGVDVTVDEGDEIPLAGLRWQVLHTPGHSTGLVCLYEPASATLLSSDHLLADISSNPVVEPPPPGHPQRLRSLALYRDSLQRVAAMRVSRALPSHGPVIHDVAGLVAERMQFHERRVARVLDALRAGARTTWDITLALFPARSPLDTFLAVSEVIGHLDLLEIDGRIACQPVDGIDTWHLLAP
ncbi:MAG: MBL fold metallo-hydrolase [Anaerolineae bacterium]|nr:MBL fold metallo-hydrolase [Anaerolineae bacterium]